MDEISERGTTRRLPASSGERLPTGQVLVTLPPGPMPEPEPEPVQPYLPPAATKATGPVTGQVASILVTEVSGAVPPTQAGRSRLRVILVAALVIAVAAVAVLFLSPTI